MEQKKKSSNFIIPATFFTSLSPAKPKTAVKPTVHKPAQPVDTSTRNNVEKKVPKLRDIRRRPSALSLKSVHQKKETKVVTDEEENFDNHPKTPFKQEELRDTWKKYYFKLQELGEKNIASILIADEPRLEENFLIKLTLPNDLMRKQLERGKPKLMAFLREKLNNYGIQITIDVNETVEKKYAYTPQEKYEKMKEKNPLIEKLKNTFGLDL